MRNLQVIGAAALMALVAGCGSSGKKSSLPGGSTAGAALAQRYQDCWGFFSAHDWKAFETCYAPGVVSDFVDSGMPSATGWDSIFAQHTRPLVDAMSDVRGSVELTLINGDSGVTVALLLGTHDGALATPAGAIPATQKKIGQQVAHAVHFARGGKAVDREWFYQDMGGMLAQLGVIQVPARPAALEPWSPETVIARGDAREKRNLGVIDAVTAAFNRHDAAAMDALMADDLVWSELGVPVDWNRAAAMASHAGLFKGFSDLKITPTTTWAAGDYVVMQGLFAGKNDGAVPDMGIAAPTGRQIALNFLQLYKLDASGKITRSWGFWNGAAFAAQLMGPPPGPAPKPPVG